MKPLLYSKPAFDANYNTTFEYIYQGNQQFANRLTITDLENDLVIYNETQTTFKLEHMILAGSLENGRAYTAEITAYDINNEPSNTSDKVRFNTFTTPSFYIENLSHGQIIKDSSYPLNIIYEQPEGELLNEFQVILYDLSHNIIDQSGYLYPVNGMTYTLKSLLDNQAYYLKLTGITVNKMALELPEIEFSVQYINPAIYSKIFLENLPLQATIKIQSNLIIIDGRSNPSPPIYIDGEKVDVRGDGHYVIYDNGFNINDDLEIQIILENINLNKTFFELSNQSGVNKIILQKWRGTFVDYTGKREYFILHAMCGNVVYRKVSNLLPVLSPSQQVELIIKRINNLYSINAKLI